jgi:hypothetical protein
METKEIVTMQVEELTNVFRILAAEKLIPQLGEHLKKRGLSKVTVSADVVAEIRAFVQGEVAKRKAATTAKEGKGDTSDMRLVSGGAIVLCDCGQTLCTPCNLSGRG